MSRRVACHVAESEIAPAWRVLRASAAGLLVAGASAAGVGARVPVAHVVAGAGAPAAGRCARAPTSGREPDGRRGVVTVRMCHVHESALLGVFVVGAADEPTRFRCGVPHISG